MLQDQRLSTAIGRGYAQIALAGRIHRHGLRAEGRGDNVPAREHQEAQAARAESLSAVQSRLQCLAAKQIHHHRPKQKRQQHGGRLAPGEAKLDQQANLYQQTQLI